MILIFTYELKMLPESPVERDQIESIFTKLMEQFEHCKPLSTCYFLKVTEEHVPFLYDELQDIGKTLHDGAIADFHFVMNPVDFEDVSFQYQFLKNESACVRNLFGFGEIVDDEAENE